MQTKLFAALANPQKSRLFSLFGSSSSTGREKESCSIDTHGNRHTARVCPTNNALSINFRLSSAAKILLISATDWAYNSVPDMQKTCMCNVYTFQLSFHSAYHRCWLGGLTHTHRSKKWETLREDAGEQTSRVAFFYSPSSSSSSKQKILLSFFSVSACLVLWASRSMNTLESQIDACVGMYN